MPLPSVAIVGLGRLGRVLAQLVEAAGGPVRAYDPVHPPPARWAEGKLSALAQNAEVVLLALPLAALDESLRALSPHLTPRHLVLDTCSVKVRPAALLAQLLPPEVPWAATHPLFGPRAVARGDAPRRAVVCPNPAHPEATAGARRLYEALGCEVLLETPEAHDRTMAETHLMACFLGEALLNAGISTHPPFMTPSFRSLAEVMETVRGEAAHLRATVYQANPYAAEARGRLLASLHAIDRGLVPTTEQGPTPDASASKEEVARAGLLQARASIDAVDQELVALLARRAELAARIGDLKTSLGQGVRDPAREEAVLQARRAWSAALGLDAGAVEEIFRSVLQFSRDLQSARLNRTNPEGTR